MSRDCLPKVGMRVRIKGDHPWSGDKGRVVSVDRVGIRRNEMAKVILERDDAMDGHGCYVSERQWELLSYETKEY